MSEIKNSFCRICINQCALKVEVENNRVTKVTGDPDNPLYKGYSCIKGRAQPDYLYHPDRLLHSLKRMPNGRFEKIPINIAMDEIADRMGEIRDQSGPASIASYAGTMLWGSFTTSMPMLNQLMDTINSPMRFDTDTLDKGGKLVATGLHGEWMAPACGFDDPDVMLLIGINPILTFTGMPAGNPGDWLKQQKKRGMKLLVIDPRRTHVAKQADQHLRPGAGQDVDILACFIRLILHEKLFDSEFVRQNVTGVEALRQKVEPFDTATVSRTTGVSEAQLVEAARTIAGKKRGYIMAGTGPHMSAQGTLTEYLVLALQSLCGYWLRAGDLVRSAPTLMPAKQYKAQAKMPDTEWCSGEPMGANGHRKTRAGLPITALPDQMLSRNKDRVRAMICIGGNPIAAIPDHSRTVDALKALDLYVQVDPWMSRSSELADYIIAPTMPLEVAATTRALDFLTSWTGYGLGTSYAQYSPAMVAPPQSSDLIDDWKFLYGLASRLGYQPSDVSYPKDEDCTTEQLLDVICGDSRIDFSVIKNKSSGDFYPDTNAVVAEKDSDCIARFDLGNSEMMRDLESHCHNGPNREPIDDEFSLRLLCRRDMHVYNSSCNTKATNRGRFYNPAYMNPNDMQSRDLIVGDHLVIRSAHGSVEAIVETDADLPTGFISIAFAFGPGTDNSDDVRSVGTNPNQLMSCDTVFDRYTGQPRMSNLPVDVLKK
ncbi:MAG: anaerobic selenocysteine-containing dehydrogenase [Parasphingorhabdus sp.]|jgi:anaerobic selenocysteine-containing dehydrogenase